MSDVKAVEAEAPAVVETTSASAPKVGFLHGKRTSVILAAIVVVLAGVSVWQFTRTRSLDQAAAGDPQVELERLVAEVGQLIVLPTDETPTVATITDPKLLKNQAFFASASEGDKVLIYSQARKAILYDPAQHKIIEVAPVNLGATTPTGQ